MRFACPFSLCQFPLSTRIKPRKPCHIRHLRGFSCFRENSLSLAFSYVLRVLFPLVKMDVSPTATTVSDTFSTKGKIAFCASGYISGASLAAAGRQTRQQQRRKNARFDSLIPFFQSRTSIFIDCLFLLPYVWHIIYGKYTTSPKRCQAVQKIFCIVNKKHGELWEF